MKKKSLFAALFVTIILISSCILGVPENERASVSFKLETTAASRNTGTDIPSDVEGHYIRVSIKDAVTKRVIISQTLPRDAKSCTFDEIQVGLNIIGKVEFFYGGDKPEKTFRSLPHTVTDGENILTALNMVTINDLIGTWRNEYKDENYTSLYDIFYMTFTDNNTVIQQSSVKYNGKETIFDMYKYESPYTVQFDGANPQKVTITIFYPEDNDSGDLDITFAADNNSFEALIEDDDDVYETITYTKYTDKLPANEPISLAFSDLYGTWTGTDTHEPKDNNGNIIGTVTTEETYIFSENKYTRFAEVIKSTYTGSGYDWAVKGYTDTQTYTVTQYEVNGSEIRVYYDYYFNDGGVVTARNDYDSFLFLNEENKEVIYDGNISEKTGSSEIHPPNDLIGTWRAELRYVFIEGSSSSVAVTGYSELIVTEELITEKIVIRTSNDEETCPTGTTNTITNIRNIGSSGRSGRIHCLDQDGTTYIRYFTFTDNNKTSFSENIASGYTYTKQP